MNFVLADTQAIVWYLHDLPRLSRAADVALTASAQAGRIYISVVTLIEVDYLTGKKSFPYPNALKNLFTHAADPNSPLEVLPVTIDVARAVGQVPKIEVPDMPDRIIAATAVAHRLPIVSSDTDIRGSATLKSLIPVIW